ncbi:UPF0481 protein [Camellia lanceoleosa]|uniref:UPF0481 protein n=1 Tax=Camellia lanceoleosa TaxID=1840588 RepID=A0ACC0HH14_9ERIC|nr:UPF0481 protein [Camellia lanceoleosa]
MLMLSMNDKSVSVPIEKSTERNECCISEQELERLLRKMVEGAHKTASKSSASIYRVPAELRKLKESAYTPRFVSIGPFHSKDQHILNSSMQDVKKSYANSLFDRISLSKGGLEEEKLNTSKVLVECVGKMRESLDKAKKCYAEEVEDVLDVEMLVIDGCFILELLYRSYRFFHMHIDEPSSDPIFGSILTDVYVRHDLLLLENQLPFFVLQALFDLTVASINPHGRPTLHSYVISYFCCSLEWKSESHGNTAAKKLEVAKRDGHITKSMSSASDLDNDNGVAKRDSHITNKDDGVGKRDGMPCASDLEYAGVKFAVGNKCCLGNVVERYFTSYAVLMDMLINTPEDVRVLEKAEIIRNHLGANEDASNLFNNLCKKTVLGEFYFTETASAAAQYRKRWWENNMAELKRTYFANPWTFIAFCAGFITFGITVIRCIRTDFH